MSMKVHQVSIRKASGYNLISIAEWHTIPKADQVALILRKQAQFLSLDGTPISARDAIRIMNAN